MNKPMCFPEGQGFIMWVCPDCGRTISCPNPSPYVPNTICECCYPDHVTQMVQCWPLSEKRGNESANSISRAM